MANLIVVGAQWGDEGKGKIVDLLTAHFDIVARYQGGHNAGHTVIVNGRKYVLHLIPAGILHPRKQCAIGNGVVIDPFALKKEIADLAAAGIDCKGRLHISNRAHVILEYHRLVEKGDEERRGDGRIGTTNRGIGPAYEDKMGRRGLRICDLSILKSFGVIWRRAFSLSRWRAHRYAALSTSTRFIKTCGIWAKSCRNTLSMWPSF